MSNARPNGPDFRVLNSAPPRSTSITAGYALQGPRTTDSGFVVDYSSPSGNNPYQAWHWIALYLGDSLPPYSDFGKYLAWDWVCPHRSCPNVGAALVAYDWQPNTDYTLVYFSWEWHAVAFTTITTPPA